MDGSGSSEGEMTNIYLFFLPFRHTVYSADNQIEAQHSRLQWSQKVLTRWNASPEEVRLELYIVRNGISARWHNSSKHSSQLVDRVQYNTFLFLGLCGSQSSVHNSLVNRFTNKINNGTAPNDGCSNSWFHLWNRIIVSSSFPPFITYCIRPASRLSCLLEFETSLKTAILELETDHNKDKLWDSHGSTSCYIWVIQ